MTRRLAFLAFLGLMVATGAFAQSAMTELKDPVLAKRFNNVSDRLVCQCGCNEVLSMCNHQNCPSAVPMRHKIEDELTAGASDDSIVAGFVKEYGPKVLSSPPAHGFDLAAWVMPGFALLVGLFFVGYVAMRWAANRRVAASAAPAPVIDPEMQRRIEAEISKR